MRVRQLLFRTDRQSDAWRLTPPSSGRPKGTFRSPLRRRSCRTLNPDRERPDMAMSWREAIERVLKEAGHPMHYADISERVLSEGYYKTAGATPDATVSAQIEHINQTRWREVPIHQSSQRYLRLARPMVETDQASPSPGEGSGPRQKWKGRTVPRLPPRRQSRSRMSQSFVAWGMQLATGSSSLAERAAESLEQQANAKPVGFFVPSGGSTSSMTITRSHDVGCSVDRPLVS